MLPAQHLDAEVEDPVTQPSYQGRSSQQALQAGVVHIRQLELLDLLELVVPGVEKDGVDVVFQELGEHGDETVRAVGAASAVEDLDPVVAVGQLLPEPFGQVGELRLHVEDGGSAHCGQPQGLRWLGGPEGLTAEGGDLGRVRDPKARIQWRCREQARRRVEPQAVVHGACRKGDLGQARGELEGRQGRRHGDDGEEDLPAPVHGPGALNKASGNPASKRMSCIKPSAMRSLRRS